MSTRANIRIVDGDEVLWFYRHHDGYPEGTLPTLNKFMRWLRAGKIRDNIGQAAGWLIVLGHAEYRMGHTPSKSWKVGAYEPTTGEHADIEYLYTIDLRAKTLTYVHV